MVADSSTGGKTFCAGVLESLPSGECAACVRRNLIEQVSRAAVTPMFAELRVLALGPSAHTSFTEMANDRMKEVGDYYGCF